MKASKGFTLIEILIVIGLIAVLAGVLIAAVNPARQFAQARNSQRFAHMNAFMSYITQNLTDNQGTFTCAAGAIPTSATKMATGVGNYDIGPCVVTTYAAALPFDPSAAGAHWTDTTDYDTGYNITRDAVTGRITVAAPSAELGAVIQLVR